MHCLFEAHHYFILFYLFMGSSSKERIHEAMSTYVHLVGQMIRYAAPCIIPSFYRGEIKKKEKYSDRAVRPCSFLLNVIFLNFFLHYIRELAYLALALRI